MRQTGSRLSKERPHGLLYKSITPVHPMRLASPRTITVFFIKEVWRICSMLAMRFRSFLIRKGLYTFPPSVRTVACIVLRLCLETRGSNGFHRPASPKPALPNSRLVLRPSSSSMCKCDAVDASTNQLPQIINKHTCRVRVTRGYLRHSSSRTDAALSNQTQC